MKLTAEDRAMVRKFAALAVVLFITLALLAAHLPEGLVVGGAIAALVTVALA